jgi:hypothetical protein
VDTAYISAFSALGGALIGGLTSFGSSWLTQRTQLRFSHDEAIKAKREALYAEFVDEASRLYGDALGHQKDDAADLVKLFAMIGRIRLVSPRPVVTAAERTFDTIIEAYLGPNRTIHEVMDDVHRGGSISLLNSARPVDRTWLVTDAHGSRLNGQIGARRWAMSIPPADRPISTRSSAMFA